MRDASSYRGAKQNKRKGEFAKMAKSYRELTRKQRDAERGVKQREAQAGEPRGKSFHPHPATKSFFFGSNKPKPAEKVLDTPMEKLRKEGTADGTEAAAKQES